MCSFPPRMLASAVVLTILAPWNASAQMIGSDLAKNKVEFGAFVRTYHRLLSAATGQVASSDWGRRALFLRTGLGEGLAVMLDGLVEHLGSTSRYPSRDYRRTTWGAGVEAHFNVIDGLGTSAILRYNEILNFDESVSHFHKRNTSLLVALPLERRFAAAQQVMSIWVGPVYERDRYMQYTGSSSPDTFTSTGNLGFVLGFSLLLNRHFGPYVQFTHANFWQAEYGASLQF